MRPIPQCVVAVVLVGCLVVAVAVAGEQECDGPYNGRTLTPEELATVLRNHQAWLKSDRNRDDERRANLCQANLQGADLQEADLAGANLQGANLGTTSWDVGPILGRSYYGAANLQRTNLQGANLQDASLFGANLQGADLGQANLQEADLAGANLQGAVYDPSPEKLPHLWTLIEAYNLEKLVFDRSPAALIALREAFKKAGMRTQERQITYAIEHTKRLRAWNPFFSGAPGAPQFKDMRPWLDQLAGKSESLFSYVLFELPSHYGMAPRRTLWGLLGLILGFALLYWIALQNASSHSGIWMILPADRLASGRGRERVVRIRPQTAKTWSERLMGEFRLFRTSLYFSLLSAFHLGWREFNVGTWIARIQRREYTLRATGWVRTVSGIQSLLSVYLLALWVLTYFGRPFE